MNAQLERHSDLVITRVFDAPRSRMWKAWSDPVQVMRWWGPKAFTSPFCDLDFRIGGKYLFCMRSDTGPDVWQKGLWSTGVYKDIVPLERIACTDSFSDDEGNIVPASYYGMEDFPLELEMTVQFKDIGDGKTEMTLHHAGLPAGMLEECRAGWNESLDKLPAVLLSEDEPVVVEQPFDVPAARLWQALINNEQMKQWYFDLPDFKPEVGCEFRFTAGNETKQYLHLCRVTEVMPERKIAYSWRYDGWEGDSLVSFLLSADGNRSRLRVIHEGLETFPPSNPDLAKKNFAAGWKEIIGTSLKNFLTR